MQDVVQEKALDSRTRLWACECLLPNAPRILQAPSSIIPLDLRSFFAGNDLILPILTMFPAERILLHYSTTACRTSRVAGGRVDAPAPGRASVPGRTSQCRKGTAMKNPVTIPRGEGATAGPSIHPETDPVLLALPSRRADNEPARHEANTEACQEQLQVIETGCGPKVETALLMDLLARSPGLGQALADPTEAHNDHHPLASVNAYKHRLHALRCEYANVRLRVYDLETQLDQSCYRIEVLEKHIRFLDMTLEQIRASRGWKLVEKFSRWRRSAVKWLRFSKAK